MIGWSLQRREALKHLAVIATLPMMIPVAGQLGDMRNVAQGGDIILNLRTGEKALVISDRIWREPSTIFTSEQTAKNNITEYRKFII